MKMPGFNAEASLYWVAGWHRLDANRGAETEKQAVVPRRQPIFVWMRCRDNGGDYYDCLVDVS